MIYKYSFGGTGPTQTADGGTQMWTIPGSVSTGQATFSGAGVSYLITSPVNALTHAVGSPTVPSNATIVGLALVITELEATAGLIKDTYVSIAKGNVFQANLALDAALPTAAPPSTFYGGPGQLWGTTWTPADIGNGVNWGFQCTATGADTVYLNGVGLWVYTLPIEGNSVSYLPGIGIKAI